MGRELARSGFRFVAFDDSFLIGAGRLSVQNPMVTLRCGIPGAPSMPGLGDVPRAAGVL
jgi:hypothetical protein